jgi:hypothetical protein
MGIVVPYSLHILHFHPDGTQCALESRVVPSPHITNRYASKEFLLDKAAIFVVVSAVAFYLPVGVTEEGSLNLQTMIPKVRRTLGWVKFFIV